MQVLEKILEEIEQKIEKAEKIIVKPAHDKLDEVANDTAEAFIEAYKECQDIIRKYMENDGWIPVEERVPEEEGYKVIVCSKKGNIDTGIYSPYTKQWFIGNISALGKDIIAWRPLPESYCPERSDNHDRE